MVIVRKVNKYFQFFINKLTRSDVYFFIHSELNMLRNLIVFLLIIIPINSVFASKLYFYHPEQNYGSESVFNPITLNLNGGFDILRNGGHDKTLSGQRFRHNFKYVWKALKDPLGNVDRKGWKEFSEEEFPNFDLKGEKLNFLPNIPIHTIGNGMQFVKVSEWYQVHHYPFPKTLGLMTTMSFQVLNEMTEQNHSDQVRTDPIADFWIYNNLGFILFSFDGVKEFFSSKFIINDWSPQPMYNPFNDQIENAGQQYSGKICLNDKVDLFCQWGVDGLIGLSYKKDNTHSLSIGGGTIVNKLGYFQQGEFNVAKAENVDPAVGFFWDKNNSLMMSVHLSGNSEYQFIRTNVFPGVVQNQYFDLGIYNSIQIKDNHLHESLLGVTIKHFPVGILKNF